MQFTINAAVLAASSGGGGGAVVAVIALIAIMVAIGWLKGRIRRAERRLLSAGVKKAAIAISNRADNGPGSPSGTARQ